MYAKAIPVRRGCGERKAGGVYAECGQGPEGSPVESFIVDPPIVLDIQAMGITPVGVKLIERDGIWHIIDWIGSQHYQNVADFIEEVRRYGLSRRLSKTLDFSKLTEQSRILVMHARAHVANCHEYDAQWVSVRYHRCPKSREDHNLPDPPLMCAGVWWQDVEGGQHAANDLQSDRVVIRSMPSFSYVAASQPVGIKPVYIPAVFASFPISRLVVVRGQHGEHEQGHQAASRSSLPVDLEDK